MNPVSPFLLKEIARRLAEASEARRIVLFGSRARGNATEDSDVDLALVFEDDQDVKAGVRKAHLALWPRPFPVDLVPITAGALQAGRSLLAREIARTGIVVYAGRTE
jgi:predicted nucleotidyltransferase